MPVFAPDISALIVPAFIAGLLTFLAPCTLPLLPAYLGFIGGTVQGKTSRRSVLRNGVFYVLGFSVIFILLGTLAGFGGASLIRFRDVLEKVGGIFIIVFGLFMLGFFKFRFLNREVHLPFRNHLAPGKPLSSFLFGATFAFGWTPCIGPILGTILTLAAARATVGSGALLLFVYSLGLAVPLLLVAAGAERASRIIKGIAPYLGLIAKIGGAFLVILGILMITDLFSVYVAFFYRWLNILKYDALLQYF